MAGEQSAQRPLTFNRPDPKFWGPALAGAALWTWLLGMFFFGPTLYAVFSGTGDAIGYVFSAGHLIGLLLFSRDSLRRRFGVWMLWALLPLTLVSLLDPPFAAEALLATGAGFASAAAVLWWVRSLQRAARPGFALAAAAGAANVVVWLLGLVSPWAERWIGGALLLLCVAVAAYAFPKDVPADPQRTQGGRERRWRPPTNLIWFGLGAYAAGGALYALLAPLTAGQPLVRWVGVWPYIVAFFWAAWRTPEASIPRLQAWSLTSIGASAVLLAASGLLPWDFPISWLLIMMGLGFADAFYWRSVIVTAEQRGMPPAAVAVAWNVFVVAATSLGMEFTTVPVAGVLIALLLFLLGPRIILSTVRGRTEPPVDLTRSEQQVLGLLLQGMTDAEMAATLQVSRNTVKFHVRNVLRKTGHANRRVLRGSGMEAPPR